MASVIQTIGQNLITEATVEELDEVTLLRSPQIDVMPIQAIIVRPFQDCLASELSAIVTKNAGELAIDTNKRFQFACGKGSGYGSVGQQALQLGSIRNFHAKKLGLKTYRMSPG